MKKLLLLLILLLFLSVLPLFSAEIEGIYFNDDYNVNNIKLPVRGYAVFNYMLVIKAYAGALYLPSNLSPSLALSETPRIIELHYFHEISAEDFRVTTIEMIKRNTTPEEFLKIEPTVNTFNGFYKRVKPGDRYRAEYNPLKGTTLYLNGKSLGLVKGGKFSKAFFSIWIGEKPIDKKFRDRLLGLK